MSSHSTNVSLIVTAVPALLFWFYGIELSYCVFVKHIALNGEIQADTGWMTIDFIDTSFLNCCGLAYTKYAKYLIDRQFFLC